MKLLSLVLILLLSSSVLASSGSQGKLQLRGVVKEKVQVEYDEHSMKVKSNSQRENAYKLKRAPASFKGYEQIQVSIP